MDAKSATPQQQFVVMLSDDVGECVGVEVPREYVEGEESWFGVVYRRSESRVLPLREPEARVADTSVGQQLGDVGGEVSQIVHLSWETREVQQLRQLALLWPARTFPRPGRRDSGTAAREEGVFARRCNQSG